MESILKYLLVADNAIVDENTGKLSVIGLFNNINIPETKDSITLSFVVAGELRAPGAKSSDTGTITVNILDSKGKIFKSEKVSGGFEKNEKVIFTIYFTFVTFEEKGEYEIEILLDGVKPTKDERHCYFSVR